MYLRAFSNTSGNILKIVTVEHGAKLPQKYGHILDNPYGNEW